MLDKIVGRDQELHAAAAFLARVAGGSSALILAGEPGIGKTTVWEETVQRARDRGCLVLSARPAEAEAKLAYAALADLFEPVIDAVLPSLAGPQRHALAVALLREDPGPGRLDQRAVAAAVLSALRVLAASAPVLVAIDDLHWLDRPTARVLEFAIRRLAGVPVSLLGCERADGDALPPLNLQRALARGQCTRVMLDPLSLPLLHQMLEQHTGRTFLRAMAARVHQATGGNPFFALELARLIPRGAPNTGPLQVPVSLRRLLQDRIADMDPGGRQALLAAAAMRAPTLELAAAAAPGRRAETLRALERAAAAGVINSSGSEISFTHPLFAAAVYSSSTPAERRLVHRRLAPLVSDIEERARHVALGAATASEQVAATVDAAAEHARRRGAPEVAAELAEHALALTPRTHAAQVHQRIIQAAEYQFHAGELRGARELLATVLGQVAGGRVRADALRLLGEIRFHEDSFTEASRLFREALEHAPDDATLRSSVGLRLAYVTASTGDFPSAAAHARQSLALAEDAGSPELLAEALATTTMTECLLGNGIDQARIDRALRLEDPDRNLPVQIRPSLIAGYLELYLGQLGRCAAIMGSLRERCLEHGQESDLGFVSSYLIWAACWAGDLSTAASYAAELMESAERLDSDSARCQALAFCALPSAYAGDAAPTRDRAKESRALAERTGFRLMIQWSCWSLGLLALSLDEPQAADAALGPLTPMFDDGVSDPIRAFWLPDEIEALIALGRLARAAALLAVYEEAAQRHDRRWALMLAARCRAMLLAAEGDLAGAAKEARQATELAEGVELRIEVARTLLIAGRIERRFRMKTSASAHLREALGHFETAGAHAWAERARAELRRVGLRPSAPAELTPSEIRVAELAASGLTNREVAAKLFISPKTVESNLARAYHKLGIRSRAELGARIARPSAP
jgi:DNA-binding CsgD family transcriptional regulator/tetratricopeptide (TPR) repeat protein